MDPASRRTRERWWAGLGAFLAGASYGVVTPLAKVAELHGIGPAEMALYQYATPLAVLGAAAWARGMPRGLGLRVFGAPVVAGVGAGLTSWCYYAALARVAPGLAVLLLFQFAWMTVALESAIARRWPSPPLLAAVGLVWVGTGLAVGLGTGAHKPPDLVGVVLGLVAGATYAVSLYANGRMDPRLPTPWRAGVAAAAACVTVALVGVTVRGHGVPVPTTVSAWGWLFALGCFSQAVPVWLVAWAAPRIGGGLTGVLASSELPVALVGSWLALGERIGVMAWLGVALILAGVALAEGVAGSSKPSPQVVS
ncbi:MAG: DMT family transporter [Firmicutes bacterium]|nr:DMT family transporter [Alicyclobacillaceae bacterium]MCL6497751.1 DMT family transporter [Bacillota bacterium]